MLIVKVGEGRVEEGNRSGLGRDKADRRWEFLITKFRVKLVHESSAVVHDLSAVRQPGDH